MIQEDKNLIYTDGVCVYVSTGVDNPVIGKVALVLADLIIISVLFFSITEAIIGLAMCTLILLSFLIRYTLWNFWGQENLIINTKSLSYQHNYGLFNTSYTTKAIHDRLIVISDKAVNKENMITCRFVTYKEANDLPVEIYSMTFPITSKQAIYMNSLIEELYINKLDKDYEFPSINLN